MPDLFNGGFGETPWTFKELWTRDDIVAYFEAKGFTVGADNDEEVLFKSDGPLSETDSVDELIYALIFKGQTKIDGCAILCIDVKSITYFKKESPDSLEIFGMGDEIEEAVFSAEGLLN